LSSRDQRSVLAQRAFVYHDSYDPVAAFREMLFARARA
jgi:hypothetical protein